MLLSIVVELSWLGLVHNGQFDSADPRMAQLVAKARGADAQFSIRTVYGYKLVYHTPKPELLQLEIPPGRGLLQTLLEELHNSRYAAHLGVCKMIAALQHQVWWPSLVQDVCKFVHGCTICQQTKDVNQL